MQSLIWPFTKLTITSGSWIGHFNTVLAQGRRCWGFDLIDAKHLLVTCDFKDLKSKLFLRHYSDSSEKKALKKNQACTLSCSFLNLQFTYMIFTVFNMVSRSLLGSLFATLWLSLELEPSPFPSLRSATFIGEDWCKIRTATYKLTDLTKLLFACVQSIWT